MLTKKRIAILHDILFGELTIKSKSTVRCLALTFDSKMTFIEQIKVGAEELMKKIGEGRRISVRRRVPMITI